MADVDATIRVHIDASAANAGLAAMQAQMAKMNQAMNTNAVASTAMASRWATVGASLNQSGKWVTGIRTMETATGRMSKAFDKGTTSMRQWHAQSKWFGTAAGHAGIDRLAAQRVKTLQTQYAALGKEVGGVQKVMQMTPTGVMNMGKWNGEAMLASQRAILFRRNLEMGANSMINWGKNTQWAGRQMLVGMGIPIAIGAAGAVSAFKDIEAASISFKRVYGDATTSAGEKARMLGVIQNDVAQEMTKYGIAVADTLDISAKAAATGAQGDNLVAATRETMRLATLGQMDYQTALESTIATQTAFGVNAKGMTRVTDFLNASENQTILSMEDMAKAIPRVAPVIKGLGGDVEDLGVLMTALRAGGVTAEQGANALKSGLGSLINPTTGAMEAMEKFGIPLKEITKANRGDLVGTVKAFGAALDDLGKGDKGMYQRQQALEALFGKYQYARMGALFKNINQKQAQETERLSKASSATLAQMSESELNQISDSALTKFQGAIERIKAAAAPLGKKVLEFLTPLIDFGAKVVDFFASNDIAGKVLLWGAAFTGLVGLGTMLTGVFANFFGTIMKGGMHLQSLFSRLLGKPIAPYLSMEELEAANAARQLQGAAQGAASGLMAEADAASVLASALNKLNMEQTEAAAGAGRVARGTAARTPQTAAALKPGMTYTPGFTQPSYLNPANRAAILTKGQTSVGTDVVVGKSWPKDEKIGERLFREGFVDAPTDHNPHAMQQTHLGSARQITQAEYDDLMARKSQLSGQAQAILDLGPQGLLVDNNRRMFLPHGINQGLKNVNRGVAASEIISQIKNQSPGYTMEPTLVPAMQSAGLSKERIADLTKDQTSAYHAVAGQLQERLIEGLVPFGSTKINDSHLQGIVDRGWTNLVGDAQTVIPGTTMTWQQAINETGKPVHISAVQDPSKTMDLNAAAIEENTRTTQSLTASQERGAVVLGQHEEAVKDFAAPPAHGGESGYTADAKPRTGFMSFGRLGEPLPEKPMPQAPPSRAASLWASMRQGGAFTGDPNAWSNKLMGLGMAADLVTMGLMTAGKDVPAWSHLLGMGMMTAASFPKMVAKPIGMLGGAAKSLTTGLKAAGAVTMSVLGGGLSSGYAKGLDNFKSFAGKLGLAGMAVAAVVGGVMVVKSEFDKVMTQAEITGKSLAASSDVTDQFAKEQGKMTTTMKQANLVLKQSTNGTIDQADVTEANTKLQGEAGQAMIAQVRTAIESGGQFAGGQSVVNQIAGLYAEGLVGKKGAATLTISLAEAAGIDSPISLIGRITEIIQDTKGLDPVEIKAKITEATLSPEVLGPMAGQAAADASMLAHLWALGEDNLAEDVAAREGLGMLMTPGTIGEFGTLQNTLATMFGSQAGGFTVGNIVPGGGPLSTFQWGGELAAQADKLNEYWTNAQRFAGPQQAALQESVNALRNYEKGVIGSQYSTDAERQRSSEIVRGIAEIQLESVTGALSNEALNMLLSGTDEMKRTVALRFDAADPASQQVLSNVLSDKNGDDLSENAKTFALALKDQNVDFDMLQRKAAAYNALPVGREKVTGINWETTGVDQLNALKPVLNAVNDLPPSINRKVNVEVMGINEAEQFTKKLERLKTIVENNPDFKIKTDIDPGNIDSVLSKYREWKEVQKEIDRTAPNAGSLSTSRDDPSRTTPEPTPTADTADMEPVTIPTKFGQPKNTVRPPEDEVKIPTKFGQPKNEIDKPEDQVKIPTIWKQPSNKIKKPEGAIVIKTRWAQPNGKIKKPEPAVQRVRREVVGKIQHMYQAIQRIRREVTGKLEDPGPVEQPVDRYIRKTEEDQDSPQLEQDIERILTLREDEIPAPPMVQPIMRIITLDMSTIPPPPVVQPVIRVPVKAMGGLVGFASGGNVDYFPRRRKLVSGQGGPEDDKIPSMLSRGEYIVRAAAVDKYGVAFLDRINSMALAGGGLAYLASGTRGKKPKDENNNGNGNGGGNNDNGGGDSGGSDKDNPVKDWRKELEKATAALKQTRKAMGNKKVGAKLLAAALATGEPKVIKLLAKGKNKDLARMARKQEQFEIKQAWAESQAQMASATKASKNRLSMLNQRSNEYTQAILALSDEEIVALKGMKKKEQKEYLKRKNKQLAKEAKISQAQEIFDAKETRKKEAKVVQKKMNMLAKQSNQRVLTILGLDETQLAEYKELGKPGIEKGDSRHKRRNKRANAKERQANYLNRLEKERKEREKLEAKQAAVESAESLKKEVAFTRAMLKPGGVRADKRFKNLSTRAMGNLTQDQWETMNNLTGKPLQDFIANLNEAAASADRLAMVQEIAAMSTLQRAEAARSKRNEYLDTFSSQAEAQANFRILSVTGKSRQMLEAENAVRQAQIDLFSHDTEIKQREIEDINKAYDEQRKILDKVEQHQQAIANIERGRISVAQALSTGDIAAAAMAAQELKATEAQFGREQMRRQMDDEQEAKVKAIQDQIDTNQDFINGLNDQIFEVTSQIALIDANKTLAMEQTIKTIRDQNIALENQADYWRMVRAEMEAYMRELRTQGVESLNRFLNMIANLRQNNPDAVPGLSSGGWVGGSGSGDSQLRALTPGEFVVNKISAKKFGGVLERMNDPAYSFGSPVGALGAVSKSDLASVYNVTVNASTTASADEIATIAVQRIKQYDSGTIRRRSIG